MFSWRAQRVARERRPTRSEDGKTGMNAIRVAELGGPEVLRLETVETPTPGAGEALVRMESVGVNFIDVYFRKGLYRSTFPFTPGSEGAGTVVAVGAGVLDVRVGDRVASQNFLGSYA